MAKRLMFLGPGNVGFEEFDPGPVEPGKVKIETLYTGISAGTEMSRYRGSAGHFAMRLDPQSRLFLPSDTPEYTYPISTGYESVGVVREVGTGVTGLRPGDVVFTYEPHQTVSVVPADEAWVLPEGIPPQTGVLIAIVRLIYNSMLGADIRLGETVVVFGLGTLGQIAGQMAKLSGARVIAVDLQQRRLNVAQGWGADMVLNPADVTDVALEIRGLTGGRGADVVFEVTGVYAGLQEAIRTVAPHSTIIGLSFYQGAGQIRLGEEFHHNCVRLKSMQDAQIPPELRHRWNFDRLCEESAAVMPKLSLEPLISHTFPIEDAAKAYALVDERPGEVEQIVFAYE